jgi:hypothetical protein
MKIGVLALAMLAAIAVQPASAQTPSATVSAASLFAEGYEIKVITDVSSDEQKSIWPNDAINPYILITLQKGVSVAVCALSMANWVNLTDATLASPPLCKKH